jgi:hypothetical protein
MASVYAPRVAQYNLNFSYQGEPCQNTMYMLHTFQPTTSILNTMSQIIYTLWAINVAPWVPNTCILNNVEAISLNNAGAPVGGHSPNVPVGGQSALDAAPNNVTIAVSFRTGYSGRSRRGRHYWVGLLEANLWNNRVENAVLAAIIDYYTEYLPIAGQLPDAVWGVYSRFENGSPRLTGLFTPINEVLFVNNVVDSQRNRLP